MEDQIREEVKEEVPETVAEEVQEFVPEPSPEVPQEEAVTIPVEDPKVNVQILNIVDPIWLGYLVGPINEYLHDTNLAPYTTAELMLSIMGRELILNKATISIWVAQDVNMGVIAGFAIVTVSLLPVPRIYIDALWQNKNYAKYDIAVKLWNTVQDWCKSQQIGELFCIAGKTGLARGYQTHGFTARGLLMSYKFEKEVKDSDG